MTHSRPKTELKKAIIYTIIASIFITLMAFFAKLSSKELPTQAILFSRYFITLIILLPFIYFNPAKQPVLIFIKTNRLALHLIRDFSGLISVFCFFYATAKISLANATVLFNTAPLFIPLIAFFWGGHQIIHRLWWGMGIGFLGILFILNPNHDVFHIGTLAGLLSGFFAAIVFVGTRYLTYSEPPLRNMFYLFLVGTFTTSFFILHKEVWKNLDVIGICYLLGVGFSGYFYQLSFTNATKHAPVRLISSFFYISVIFSLLLDWLVWHEVPRMFSLLGIFLIIFGACLLLYLFPKDKK